MMEARGRLAGTERVLRAVAALNLLAGVLIALLLAAGLVAGPPVMEALGVPPGPGGAGLARAMRLTMLLGVVAVPVAHLALTRLRRIVATVGRGDPFVPENAVRLRTIGWAVLALEILRVGVGAAAASAGPGRLPDVRWSLALAPWLAVLLLFVLARVFEQGARMRDDLAGTV